MESAGQFIAIDLGAVANGVEHPGGLERFPTLLRLVPGTVEQDEVGVQLRVQGAGRRVQEGGADQVGRDAILILDAAFANPSPGELFQFPERNGGRFPVRLQDAPIIHRDGENGHGFGRSTLEVEEYPPVFGRYLRQLFARGRMQVVAQS